MTVMPAEIAYGYVDARIILASADGPDAGRLPDPQPATGTTIKVTPKTQIVRTTGEAVPTLIAKQPVTCEVDSDGYLVDSQGARGVWLVTGVYTVAYSSPAASIPGHDIEVLSTHTETAPLNLVNAMPPGGPVLSASEYAELSARIDALPGGSGAVSSVNGKTGAVVLNAADVSALPSTYTPPDQSWTQITGKPTTFPPATHTHTTADVTDIDMVTTPPADGHVLTYLAVSGKWEPRFPAAPSWDSITGKPATFPPSAHTHAAADVTSGVLAPARLGTGTASASTVLYGDGTWKAAPSGGGGAATYMAEHVPGSDVDVAWLPGRPVSAAGSTLTIPANMVVGTLWSTTKAMDPWRVSFSISTAAAAGSIARVWLASWDRATRTATLVRDYGGPAIDAATTSTELTFATAGTVPAGEYVLCFVPNASVGVRVKYVHDAIGGFQSGSGAWNAGNNRLLAAPYNQLAAFPASAPATQTLDFGVSIIFPYSIAQTLVKFRP